MEFGKMVLHFVLVALIFMSRIYLEMHSMNQACLSLVLGIYTHMLYNTIFKKQIHRFILFLADSKPNKITWTLFAVLLQIAMFVLSYQLYRYDLKNSKEREKEWLVLITKNMGGKITNAMKYKILAEKTFTDGSISGAITGMLLGLLWQ